VAFSLLTKAKRFVGLKSLGVLEIQVARVPVGQQIEKQFNHIAGAQMELRFGRCGWVAGSATRQHELHYCVTSHHSMSSRMEMLSWWARMVNGW
jgi:hypothetical protein